MCAHLPYSLCSVNSSCSTDSTQLPTFQRLQNERGTALLSPLDRHWMKTKHRIQVYKFNNAQGHNQSNSASQIHTLHTHIHQHESCLKKWSYQSTSVSQIPLIMQADSSPNKKKVYRSRFQSRLSFRCLFARAKVALFVWLPLAVALPVLCCLGGKWKIKSTYSDDGLLTTLLVPLCRDHPLKSHADRIIKYV